MYIQLPNHGEESTFSQHGLEEVVVDPNSISRRDPRLSLVRREDAPLLRKGQPFYAIQTGEDGELEGRALAWVESVDEVHGLVLVEIDWSTFRLAENKPMIFLSAALGHVEARAAYFDASAMAVA